ncbi:MarR family winged helix-turn-helix transcriptional regulator [Mycoplasma sp. P36-A1]|uniref:MarR family winged helix-turn-helix transcriptional regulator n=1 Tax=Mycoplasma sp. P36-A1 TaxID=3252900 RepID=UPI003C2F3A22
MYDISFGIFSLNKIIQAKIEDDLKQFNISFSQAKILEYILDNDQSIQDEISFRLNIKKSMISQLIKNLITKELVIMQESKKDKRIKILLLTTKGKDITLQFKEYIQNFNKNILENVGIYNQVNLEMMLNEIMFTIKR